MKNLDPLLQAIIVSASLGSLIGLERQWKTQHDESGEAETPTGLRTFTLWAIFGAVSAHIASTSIAAFYPVAFGSLAALLALRFVFDPEQPRLFGFTTITAAFITFTIGSLVYWQQTRAAVVLTVFAIILMASKDVIHEWTSRLTRRDVRSALQFAAITGIVLPLVPNSAFGPFEAFNPFNTWLMVVLVSGISFLGYVAMRLFGSYAGIGFTGIIGGLVSSTATALAFSRQSKTQPRLTRSFILAIILASTVMFARMIILISATNFEVLTRVWIALLFMALPGICMAAWLWHFSEPSDEIQEPQLDNPLGFRRALQFAIAYAFIVFLVKVAHSYGNQGIYGISFLSGLTNTNAITLSLTQMVVGKQISGDIAAKGILLAAISATALKAGFVMIAGSAEIRRAILLFSGITTAAGIIGWWMI